MFDKDGSGTIDEEEFMNLCTCTPQAQRVNMPQASSPCPPQLATYAAHSGQRWSTDLPGQLPERPGAV